MKVDLIKFDEIKILDKDGKFVRDITLSGVRTTVSRDKEKTKTLYLIEE